MLTGKTRRALDSTVLDDAVATQDTVTQLVAAVRRVAREGSGAAAVITEQASAHDYTDPGKPRIAWDDPDARTSLIDALVGDAHRILGLWVPETRLTSCDLLILVDQSAESIASSDVVDLGCCVMGKWS